jgi:hypothetical protein
MEIIVRYIDQVRDRDFDIHQEIIEVFENLRLPIKPLPLNIQHLENPHLVENPSSCKKHLFK